MYVARFQTHTLAAASRYVHELGMFVRVLLVLCPFLFAWVFQDFQITFEPSRIAAVEDVQKVTYAVSVTKTKDTYFSSFMQGPDVLNIGITKRRTCGEKDRSFTLVEGWNCIATNGGLGLPVSCNLTFISLHPSSYLFLMLLSTALVSLRNFPLFLKRHRVLVVPL